MSLGTEVGVGQETMLDEKPAPSPKGHSPLFAIASESPQHSLHFLFGNSLIDRLTPYFFDSQTLLINVLSSFVNIFNFLT